MRFSHSVFDGGVSALKSRLCVTVLMARDTVEWIWDFEVWIGWVSIEWEGIGRMGLWIV